MVSLCSVRGHPDAFKWLQLPEAPSEDGIEAAAPDPPTGLYLCAPQNIGDKLLTVAP